MIINEKYSLRKQCVQYLPRQDRRHTIFSVQAGLSLTRGESIELRVIGLLRASGGIARFLAWALAWLCYFL